MMKFPFRIYVVLASSMLWGALLAHGQGGSGVITLVMPPPGGEGYSMLQAGGMFADGATAAYYNPALLADLERHTGASLHYTRSHQDLLPELGLPDLYNQYWGVAAVLPDAKNGTDLGVGIFRTFTSFGPSEDPYGSKHASTEAVSGLALGLRLGLPIYAGASVKFIDSRLAPEWAGAEPARSFAFDAGVSAHPRFLPPASWRLASLQLAPSFGLAMRNMGPDVFYAESSRADPLPLTLAAGAGMNMRLVDFFEVSAAYGQEREVPRFSGWSRDPAVNVGFSAAAGFFRFSRGWLDDPSGRRREIHTAHAVEFDMLRMHRFLSRLRRGDFRSPAQAFDGKYALAPITLLGLPYRLNPRASAGMRRIEGRDQGIRDGQDALFFNFSL